MSRIKNQLGRLLHNVISGDWTKEATAHLGVGEEKDLGTWSLYHSCNNQNGKWMINADQC